MAHGIHSVCSSNLGAGSVNGSVGGDSTIIQIQGFNYAVEQGTL